MPCAVCRVPCAVCRVKNDRHAAAPLRQLWSYVPCAVSRVSCAVCRVQQTGTQLHLCDCVVMCAVCRVLCPVCGVPCTTGRHAAAPLRLCGHVHRVLCPVCRAVYNRQARSCTSAPVWSCVPYAVCCVPCCEYCVYLMFARRLSDVREACCEYCVYSHI